MVVWKMSVRFAFRGLACAAWSAGASCVPVGGNEVAVVLREFSVVPDPTSATAGSITFRVTNAGDEGHEFLVIKTDLAPDALPTEPDGSYQENGAGTELIDEIGFIASGEAKTLTLELEAGKYVLICNFVDVEDGQIEAHYALGMFGAFAVE